MLQLRRRKLKIKTIFQKSGEIAVLQNGIKMAEKIIKEGNEEVQSHLMKKVLNRVELTQSNMKVATGVKRREEFSLEIRELEKKIAKLIENP